MERSQFTFYRSYFEAVKALPKKDQAAVLLAVCAYALDSEEPKLSGTASAIFRLIRPTLDTGRRKAMGGMKRSFAKDSEKSAERQREDTSKITERQREDAAKEKEKEIELERDIENECYPPTPLPAAKRKTGNQAPDLSSFSAEMQEAIQQWLKYKTERRESYKPTGLQAFLTTLRKKLSQYSEKQIIDLMGDCMSNGWRGIIWDRLEQPSRQSGSGNPFLDMLREEI